MTTVEQRRAWVLAKILAGELEVAEAAELLGVSEPRPASSSRLTAAATTGWASAGRG